MSQTVAYFEYLIVGAKATALVGVVAYLLAIVFGFAMGADYMLIPLMAAKQFGVNSLGRAMAVILPVNTIGQTWLPFFVSLLRDRLGSYSIAMGVVLAVALIGAVAIAILPRHQPLWPQKT